MKRFWVLNPTSMAYSFAWEAVDTAIPGSPASPFHCSTMTGVLAPGKRYEMVFQYTPNEDKLQVLLAGRDLVPGSVMTHSAHVSLYCLLWSSAACTLHFHHVHTHTRTKAFLSCVVSVSCKMHHAHFCTLLWCPVSAYEPCRSHSGGSRSQSTSWTCLCW